MQKATVLLVAISGVVALGIILSFYGNQVLFEDLVKGEGNVVMGEDLIVSAELERSDSQRGIYAIQIVEYRDDISAHILDPYDIEIGSKVMDSDLFEGEFEVEVDGVYKLVVKNDSTNPVKIFGVIGPEPDAGAKSLGFVSLYVLVIGLIGMIGVGVFAVRKRRRS